ncbi:hypothetical protein K488DRAFT_82172 [Vararia minispora EC-137]|uniref:Uncharacterized protein n=1 Tax=Vararia minispora EC-137 TaxID=1314806 RepID=A0ACB8QXF4_9AGAM|nr:hypothetical protein K488DRAFT_82172 [Vararia minispora EC-137]
MATPAQEAQTGTVLGNYQYPPITHDFRDLKEVTLEGLDIVSAERPLLLDRDQLPAVVSDSADCAKEHIWSSDMLFRHLNMLNDFASPNVAGARLWINAFFFRVNAMLNSPEKGLVLSLEQGLDVPVNPRTALCGVADYVVLRGSKTVTGRFFPSSDLTLQRNRDGLSFLVEEAKSFEVPLEQFLPQTVGEIPRFRTTNDAVQLQHLEQNTFTGKPFIGEEIKHLEESYEMREHRWG